HLLVDMAVPARVHGHWHYFGDPLESWVEAALERGESFETAPRLPPMELEAVIEQLARCADEHPSDTTRNLWGWARYQATGAGQKLEASVVAEQARVLVPRAIRHLEAFLVRANE